MKTELKLKKQKIKRGRFLEIIKDFELSDWLQVANESKSKLALVSNLQLGGNNHHFAIQSSTNQIRLLIPVIGPSTILEQNYLQTFDRESQEILIYQDFGHDLFTITFPELIAKAKNLHSVIQKKSALGISADFDLVFDNEKIELHFFIQKDYIQIS